ncbi:hypothetical protein PS718_05588 [Pseudomonas fluorescens]|uniref:Uncharacterized protein n=1 Tax=Pseudomonas fluorescens TaxID=294 RepID=A0A5E7FGN2_PSEFL|nr:hypothetical protein PS718_05588 [Pseudomonas fluorescens]
MDRYAIASLLEMLQCGVALDADAIVFEALDQQLFMLVLREYFDERVGRQALADAVQRQLCDRFAIDPEVCRRDLMTVAHDGLGQVQLPIQLQRSRLHRQRPGSGARCGGLVDDAHLHAQFAQPQGQHQPGGAGADDQDIAAVHGCVLLLLVEQVWIRRRGWPVCRPDGKRPRSVEVGGPFWFSTDL